MATRAPECSLAMHCSRRSAARWWHASSPTRRSSGRAIQLPHSARAPPGTAVASARSAAHACVTNQPCQQQHAGYAEYDCITSSHAIRTVPRANRRNMLRVVILSKCDTKRDNTAMLVGCTPAQRRRCRRR
eukprot:308001-Prorocentrum_minimum.AAC.1